MSNKKVKPSENIENLCPLNRKRNKSTTGKATPFQLSKIGKLETASSPAALEYLDEMGISVLESEESSSSLASAPAVPLNDENSNEATPNLDAAKLNHQRVKYRAVDNLLDNSTDNLKGSSPVLEDVNKNSDFEVYSDGLQQPHQQHHPKKVTFLGGGVGINAQSSNPTLKSPTSSGRGTRSPLAMVTCNNQLPSASKIVQQESTQQPPSLPSTSRQAANIKQQRHFKQLPSENFFLFRNYASTNDDGVDHFGTLSEEIILHILKWLPKKTLIRCTYVCRRLNRLARDESLWTRLDLSRRSLRAGAMQNVLCRGVVVLRIAQAEVKHPAFTENFLQCNSTFQARLQYLDLSMTSISKSSLTTLLSYCHQLKKLSLEHVDVNDEVCNEIARNTKLEALNMTMCVGLEAWSVRKMMETLQNLSSLNISWTDLSVDAVTSLVTNVTPNILRLNIAGCRKTMFDSHILSLTKRCPQLIELDLSDCTGLTGDAIPILCKFPMLEYLSLSRCYLIPASSYMDFKNSSSLAYLDIFGMLSDSAMEVLEQHFPSLEINKFINSSVARPTVGTRRTSIWGLRTRD